MKKIGDSLGRVPGNRYLCNVKTQETNMKPLFFLFDISPEVGALSILVFIIAFVWLLIKDAGKKSYEKKSSQDWTKEDWQDYLEDVQKRLDELSDK